MSGLHAGADVVCQTLVKTLLLPLTIVLSKNKHIIIIAEASHIEIRLSDKQVQLQYGWTAQALLIG